MSASLNYTKQPHVNGRFASVPVMDRFWAKVHKSDDPDGCWLWAAATDIHGYGRFWFYKKMSLAHRVAYELLKGPIPAGLQLDHLCRNPACVNPDHLEPVTSRTNLIRGEGVVAACHRKTHCKQGHPFSPENTRINRHGHRVCRACEREHDRRRYQLGQTSRQRQRRLASQARIPDS